MTDNAVIAGIISGLNGMKACLLCSLQCSQLSLRFTVLLVQVHYVAFDLFTAKWQVCRLLSCFHMAGEVASATATANFSKCKKIMPYEP